MKLRLAALAAAMLALALPARAETVTPSRAADVGDSLCVGIHANYTDGAYVNAGKVLSTLKALGVTTVRTAAPKATGQGYETYKTLAAAGVRFIFIVRDTDIAGFVAEVKAFLALYPKSVVALEGPNEVNNWAITYKGQSGTPAALAFQADLYDAIKADAALNPFPVLNFTDSPNRAGKADVANIHPYTLDGAQPYGRILAERDQALAQLPGKPFWITELGYPTMPVKTWIQGVDAPTQAQLTVNAYLDAWLLGSRRTCVFRSLDAYPDYWTDDAAKVDAGRHFGLFDILYQPKPAARAVASLSAALSDTSPDARSFAPSPLSVTILGPSGGYRSLAVQRASGRAFVILWDARKPDAALAAQTVTIEVGTAGAGGAISGTDLVTGAPIALSAAGGSLRIPVTLQGNAVVVPVN